MNVAVRKVSAARVVLTGAIFIGLVSLQGCQPAQRDGRAVPDRNSPSTGASVSNQSAVQISTTNAATAQTPAPDALASMRAEHTAIGVPNFEESVRWYTEKLGFREVQRWTVKELPGVQLAYLDLNGFRMEVVGGGKRTGRTAPTATDFVDFYQTVQGYFHLSLRVDDVDAALAELNRRGVETFIPAADYPVPGVRIGFVKDNNGNLIEFAGPLADAQRGEGSE